MEPPWQSPPPPWPNISRQSKRHKTSNKEPTTPDQHTYEKAHQNLIKQPRNDEEFLQDCDAWAKDLAMTISAAIHEVLSKELEQLKKQVVFEYSPLRMEEDSATTPAATSRATTAPPEKPAVVPNPIVPNPTALPPDFAPSTDFAPCCLNSTESTNPATNQVQDQEPLKFSPRIIKPVLTTHHNSPACRPEEKPPDLYTCCTTADEMEIVSTPEYLHHAKKPPGPTKDNLQDEWIHANDPTKHNPIDRGPLVLQSLRLQN